MKKILATLIALILVFALWASAALAATVYISQEGGSLKLRSGPGTNYAVAGYVQHGDSVTVQGTDGSWSKVYLARTGKTGYIKTLYLRETSSTVYISAEGGSLKLRSGPGTNYAVAGYVQHGDSVTVQGTDGSWSKVYLARTGKSGYIRTQYLRSAGSPGWNASSGSGSNTSVPEWTIGWGAAHAPSNYVPARVMTKTVQGVVNLRSGPGTGYSSSGKLRRGDFLKVTETSGEWRKVVTSGGASGYVQQNYVSLGVRAQTTGNVHFRTGKGTQHSVLQTLPKGTSVTILSVEGSWAKAQYGTQTGYLSTSYFQF